MKNLIKTLITTILVASILVTGISVDTTTATAKTTKGGEFKNGGTVTIKPGDTLKLTVTDTNGLYPDSEKTGYDIVGKYKWSSSDTSVLNVETDFYDEEEGWTECVSLIAAGAGTATVTGEAKSGRPDITMTVNVTLPKATAKQKKCKHKYKVTKKATCERAGIKTCKKCKFQKSIKKLGHKYVNKTVTVTKYEYYIENEYCNGHNNDHNCTFKLTVKFDGKTGEPLSANGIPVTTTEEITAIMDKHWFENEHAGSRILGDITYYNPYEEEETIKVCTRCGDEKFN